MQTFKIFFEKCFDILSSRLWKNEFKISLSLAIAMDKDPNPWKINGSVCTWACE